MVILDSSLFGSHVPLMDHEISCHEWRSERPIGPLGRLVTVKPTFKTYVGAIEAHLGSDLLLAYLVFGRHDRDELIQMFKRVLGSEDLMPDIIMCGFTDVPLSHNQVFQQALLSHPDFETCYNVINCASNVVTRILCNFANIHRTILVPDMDTAYTFVGNPAFPEVKAITPFGAWAMEQRIYTGGNLLLGSRLLEVARI